MPRAVVPRPLTESLLELVMRLLEDGSELASAADRDGRLEELADIGRDIALFSAAAARTKALHQGEEPTSSLSAPT